MRTTYLSKNHYASKWIEQPRSVEETNVLGLKFALLSDGPEKEAALLEILQKFHSYLVKYMGMICGGVALLGVTGTVI